MSGMNQDQICAAHAAARIDAEAISWVERADREDWSANEKASLDEWLAQSTAHTIAYLRARDAWQRANRLAALRGTFGPPRNTAAARGKASRLGMVAGLAVAVSLAALGLLLPGAQSASQTYSTVVGGHKTLALNDGTRIELNTNTQLRTQFDEHHRTVWIDHGEAYFEVAHNAAKPFVVLAGNHRITDLGTKFLVKQQPGQIQVSLIEGRAEIDTPATPRQAHTVLEPGDVAVATADETRVTKKAARDISDSLAWQRGAIVFRNEHLADAVAEFNRYGGPQLIVADASAAKLRINGTFQTTGAEDFAGITHEIFGLNVKRQNGNIVLSR